MENNNDFEKALELNERIHESGVAQDHSPERAVELPTDEVNIEASERTFSDELIECQTVNDLKTEVEQPAVTDEQRDIVQKSIRTFRELTNVPDVHKALEAEGLTVDFKKVFKEWYDSTTWEQGEDVIRPMTEEEKANAAVACACTDCVDAADHVD